MIVGLGKSDEGSIHINDENITLEPIHNRFEQGISYLQQEPSVFRDMTAKENIEAILEVDNSLSLLATGTAGGDSSNLESGAVLFGKDFVPNWLVLCL